MEYAGDFFGSTALVATAMGLCLRSDRALRVLNLSGVVFWALHFGFIGAAAACGMLCLAGVMIVAALRGWDGLGALALWVNIALLPIVAALLVVGWADWGALASVLGGLLINVGICRFKGHGMTVMIAAGELVWVVAGVLIGSVPAVLSNLLNLSALFVRTVWIFFAARRARASSGSTEVSPSASG